MVYFWLFVQKPTSDLDKVGLLELSLHFKKHSYQIGLKYYVYYILYILIVALFSQIFLACLSIISFMYCKKDKDLEFRTKTQTQPTFDLRSTRNFRDD